MKLKSKWIKDLHVKSDTLNPVKEKECNSLELFSTGDDFLNRTPIAWSLRKIINKWDLVNWKSFCKAKDKMATYRMGKIFTNSTFNRAPISKTYKELKKLGQPSDPG